MTDEDVANEIHSSLGRDMILPSKWSITAAKATVRWAQLIGLVVTEVGSDAQGGTYVMLEDNDCEPIWVGHMNSGFTSMIDSFGDILLKSRLLPLPTGNPP